MVEHRGEALGALARGDLGLDARRDVLGRQDDPADVPGLVAPRARRPSSATRGSRRRGSSSRSALSVSPRSARRWISCQAGERSG
ncbi:MAG: hypothetical protein MZW92_30020 [Comamonadaceae bacterium]|nr:hypothetical protein [Comamonadaceae bacterium]